MQDYEKLYNNLKEEYETYQRFAERHRQELYEKNIKLEKSNDSLANIVEISKYINTFFSDDNLISMINDMIIGILGVTYSTIYLRQDSDIIIKASNIEDMKVELSSDEITSINNKQEFIINSEKPLKVVGSNKVEIHSMMGVPIFLRDKFMGYIIVEHKVFNFMNTELKVFLKSIANQIAISIENSYLYKQLERTTQRDALLDIYNRKYFFEHIESIVQQKTHDKFAIVMIDIDDFKKVNDNFGHQFGDKVLINTAHIIESWLGKNDIIARYGGEEIILYLTDFETKSVIFNKVEIIRKAIESSMINFNNMSSSVTASFGISYYPTDGNDINQLIKLADDLLYKAKKAGKNRVISLHEGNVTV